MYGGPVLAGEVLRSALNPGLAYFSICPTCPRFALACARSRSAGRPSKHAHPDTATVHGSGLRTNTAEYLDSHCTSSSAVLTWLPEVTEKRHSDANNGHERQNYCQRFQAGTNRAAHASRWVVCAIGDRNFDPGHYLLARPVAIQAAPLRLCGVSLSVYHVAIGITEASLATAVTACNDYASRHHASIAKRQDMSSPKDQRENT